MKKHNLNLQSIALDRKSFFEFSRSKRRKHLQKIKLTFSGHTPSDRKLVKFLTQTPLLKKITLEIQIDGIDSKLIMAKFSVIKEFVKKIFTLAKRIVDLKLSIFDLLPFNYKILTKLNNLANLEIILMEPISNDYYCLEAFLGSSRTKKTFAKLQSLNIPLTQDLDISQKSAKFTEFSTTVTRINSLLQFSPSSKSSLSLFSLRSEPAACSALLGMFESSPHLTAFSNELSFSQDYTSLFDKLATLNHLSSLKFNPLSIEYINLDLSIFGFK